MKSGDGQTEMIECCGQLFETPADLGRHLGPECDGFDRVAMADEDTPTVESVAQISTSLYGVVLTRDEDSTQYVVADLIDGSVEPKGFNTSGLSDGHQATIIRTLVEQLPDVAEGTIVNVSATASGGGGAPAGGSGGDGEDSFDGDVVNELSGHDDEEDAVDDWLSNYASVKSSMIDGGWSTTYAELTDPQSGETVEGVHIDVAPFYAGSDVWDSENSTWAHDDAQDEFADHREAMKGIFKDDSEPVELIVDDDDDFGWYNYVPADAVDDL